MKRPRFYNIGSGLIVNRTDTINSADYKLYRILDCSKANIILSSNPFEFLEKAIRLIGEKYRAELKWWLCL